MEVNTEALLGVLGGGGGGGGVSVPYPINPVNSGGLYLQPLCSTSRNPLFKYSVPYPINVSPKHPVSL